MNLQHKVIFVNPCGIFLHYSSLLVLSLLLVTPNFIFANLNMDIKRLPGVVIQKEDSAAIENVHVINLTRMRGTSSLDDGSFAINMMEGDTILFQAMGFKNDTIFVTEKFFRETDYVIIELRKRIYDLPGVDVFPYATFSEFRQAFICFDDDKITDTVPRIDLDLPEQLYLAPTSEGAGVTMTGPVTLLYEQFSQRGREKRKYREVKEQAKKDEKMSRLVNPTVVKRLTGLEDIQEINDFLDFCNLSYDFVVNSKEYQVYQTLLICYRQYKQIER